MADPSQGSNNTGITIVSSIFAAVGGGIVAAIVLSLILWGFGAFDGKAAQADTKVVAQEGLISADFAKQAAEVAGPSVVSIIAGNELVDPATGHATSSPEATGSGVIISEDGYIVTNNHVVTKDDLRTPEEEVLVQFGAENVPARIVGRDAINDIAVIKVDRTGLDPIEVGSSAELKPGDPVVVIGNPKGIGISVATGIVSAVGRTFGEELVTRQQAGGNELAQLAAAIQVDAAVNHGNSGGALVNAKGEWIGIPSAGIFGDSVSGLNFCIPIGIAKGVVEDLIAYGRSYNPYLGANVETINLVIADAYELPVEKGAYVDDVDPGSPAETGGIEAGDIIVTIDGKSVGTQLELAGMIRSLDIGQTITVELWRMDPDTEKWDSGSVDVTLGEVESIR